jgi:hypothetical protein
MGSRHQRAKTKHKQSEARKESEQLPFFVAVLRPPWYSSSNHAGLSTCNKEGGEQRTLEAARWDDTEQLASQTTMLADRGARMGSWSLAG